MRAPPAPPRPQLHFHHFREEASEKRVCTGSGCFVVIRFPLQKTIENDISCSNIIKFQESLAKNKVKWTFARARRNPSKSLVFGAISTYKHQKTNGFSTKKMSKSHPARSCGFVGNPTLFQHFCQTGFCEQLFRTSATTVAHLPGPSSLSNNTMRDRFVFSSRAHAEISKNHWVLKFCGCVPRASVVATVVRTPRSEVSQRHRAGSWVWVVAKSRLDIW